MASKIGKTEWWFLYGITGIIDIIQYVIDFTGIGEVINMIFDPACGALIGVYFQLRGVSMIKRPGRLISLVGVAGIGELTGGIASFWIVDIWYIQRSVKQEDAELQAQKEQEEMLSNTVQQPLYKDGVRQPQMVTQTANTYDPSAYRNANTKPLVNDGIRRASKT
ncbi:hypothetical protein KGQ27_00245 [Patescibacteria group bacterium]|nr:hypothetical protein [Patescibacteria group bacterium]MDE1946646.1 hypothetical protein [Patescibacteria group bacterium]MDE2010599.1 hypothetical protein [Patescibacteria group bacterium]MDE2232954.1 hypothetical protein [Patescibacteria group bacterium]